MSKSLQIWAVNFICLSITLSLSLAETQNEKRNRLLGDIFKDYDAQRFPKKDPESGPIRVGAHIRIIHIDELNQKQETVQIHGYVNLVWTDEYLSWNPTNYGGLNRVTFQPKGRRNIWRPSLKFHSAGQVWASTIHIWRTPTMLTSSGFVWLRWEFSAKPSCNFDYVSYPNDIQLCPLVLASPTMNSAQLEFSYAAGEHRFQYWNTLFPHINTNITQTGQWQLIDYNLTKAYVSYKGRTTNLTGIWKKSASPVLELWLKFQRRNIYFTVTIQIPALIIGFLTITGLLLEDDIRSLAILTINLLLYGLLLNDMIRFLPPATSGLPNIVVYYGLMLGSNILVILLRLSLVWFKQHHNELPQSLKIIFAEERIPQIRYILTFAYSLWFIILCLSLL